MSNRKHLAPIALVGLLFASAAHAQLTVTSALQAADKGSATAPAGEKKADPAEMNGAADCKVSRDPVQCDTALQWYLLEDAIKLAKHQNKLLMVLHLSGNFEKQAFT